MAAIVLKNMANDLRLEYSLDANQRWEDLAAIDDDTLHAAIPYFSTSFASVK